MLDALARLQVAPKALPHDLEGQAKTQAEVFTGQSGGGSSAGLRTLPSKAPPKGGKGGHEGGGTKVEGFKPCYEGKV